MGTPESGNNGIVLIVVIIIVILIIVVALYYCGCATNDNCPRTIRTNQVRDAVQRRMGSPKSHSASMTSSPILPPNPRDCDESSSSYDCARGKTNDAYHESFHRRA